MKIGDKVIFYHSNSEPPGAAGICEIVKERATQILPHSIPMIFITIQRARKILRPG